MKPTSTSKLNRITYTSRRGKKRRSESTVIITGLRKGENLVPRIKYLITSKTITLKKSRFKKEGGTFNLPPSPFLCCTRLT